MAKSGSMILVILNIDLYQQSYCKGEIENITKRKPLFLQLQKTGVSF